MRQSTSSPLTEALQPCNLHIHFQTHQPRVSCRQQKHVAPAVTDNRGNLRRGREAKKSSTVAKAPQDPCPDREGGCQHQQPRKGQPGMGRGHVSPTSHHQPVLNGATTTAHPSAQLTALSCPEPVQHCQAPAGCNKEEIRFPTAIKTETSAWLLSGVGAQQRRKQLTLPIQLSALSEKPSHILPSRCTRKIPPLEPLLP